MWGEKWESCQGFLLFIELGSDIFTGEFYKTSRNDNLDNTEISTEKGKQKSIQIHFDEAIEKKAWQS